MSVSSRRPISKSSQSVEIDLSDVALAPGPPPMALRNDLHNDDNQSIRWEERQGSWPEEGGGGAGSSMQDKRSLSQFEEISPWNFQGNEPGSRPKARSRQNTSETFLTNSASAFYTSQASLPARPSTPSASLRDSTGAATMSNTTPLSGRRSKNPLNFFRKKSNINMREEGISPSSSIVRAPPLPGTPANSYSGVFASSSVGLDEEMLLDEHEAAVREAKRERRLLGRPRTRDKEAKKAKANSDMWDPELADGPTFHSSLHRPGGGGGGGGAGGGGVGGGGGGEEVSLALDTNFEQIDDIVDTSVRQSSLVGPMNERLSPEVPQTPLSPLTPTNLSFITPSKTWSKALDRSSSVTFIDPPKSSQTLHHSEAMQQRRPLLHRMGSSGLALTESSFHSSPERSGQPLLQFNQKNTNLRKLTKAEAQQLLSQLPRRNDLSPGDVSETSTVSPPRPTNGGGGGGGGHHLQPFSDDFSVASDSPTIARDHRKASYASSSSRVTSDSGISPTTSLSNLANKGRDKGDIQSATTPTAEMPWNEDEGDVLDHDYKFPNRRPSEGPRKSSASSGKVASSWMAPDSWAVQPGKIRDALRDEDEEEERAEEAAAALAIHHRDISSSSSIGVANGKSGSMSSSGIVPSTSIDGQQGTINDRRETMESNLTTSSNGLYGIIGKTQSQDSVLEVLAGSPASGHASARPPSSHNHHSSHHRPTSRGTSIGGAATAAAGKFNLLNRPSRIKLNVRPNTAGSVQGVSGKLQSGHPTPTSELEGFSWNQKKRPTTANANQGTGKMTYLRVYRANDTHTVVSIPLTATAAELRVLLARKVMDGTAKRLFVRDKGSERPLGESEKPAILQRRRLEQAGYTENDGLDELGREDMSFLLKFVYRPDSVTTLESNAFGDTETDFNRLDLQNKNLEMVPIFLYRHAEWIQSLDLSGNPMSDLPLDFVQLCSNLTTLRMSHLALKRIPKSIRQAVNLTHLDISDNRIPELSHINFNEIPQLMSLKVQNNRLSELPSYFGSMSKLRDLNISNNRFEVFPPIICRISTLSQLDISFNTITELPDEMGNLIHLQRLVLVGNTIVKLPASFDKLDNLQAIDLRRNLLQDVSTLFTLPKLQVLQCEHNSIKNLSARFGIHLRKLEIGHNPLSKAVFTASDICALTSLDLSSANMGRLDDDVLSHLPNLLELILDQNTLVVLPDNLGDLSQLRKLSCSNNLLATLPDSLGNLTKLEELQVHNNNLKSLPASIWLCGKLHTINVSSNLLETFPEPSLNSSYLLDAGTANATTQLASQVAESRRGSESSQANLPTAPSVHGSRHTPLPLSSCLNRLRLGDNRLTEDIFDVLGHLTNLKILNLSCNEIYELPNYGLATHTTLEELYLSGNSLSSIPADVLPLLQELRILHLNGNKLQTLPAELGRVMKLVNLDVGNNSLKYNISNQQYDWNWNSNPNLRYLNLSGNKRLEIKSNPVLVGGGGADQRSGWKRTDSSDFQRLTNLRLLGLMDVTVTLHQMPDQFEDRRVRTSLSQINQMAYGISDALGINDHLSIIDVVIPRFRKLEHECMFGLFAGRGHSNKSGSRIAFHLAEWVQFRIQWEVRKLQTPGHLSSPELEQVADILRRAFLRMEKEYADVLITEGTRKKGEAMMMALKDERKVDAPAIADSHQAAGWKSGASAVLAYVINRTVFIANVGDSLAVLCRNSQAVLVSTKHEPFNRNETLRIRSAEGWVSLHGQVNDKLDVSRSFGHYHLAHVVNAAPAVTQIDLTDSDEFLILANRTLWDFIPYQTAVDIARMDRDDPMLAAQKLRDFAISYGAEDSIMVMVVAVGDLFEKSRNGSTPYSASTYHHQFGMLNEPNSAAAAAYDNDVFKKINTRRAREDLPGDRTLARLQREVAPPIGQVALVFTDIKNSTALWETNGGMQSAMRLHNFLLRRQLRNIGGYEVKTEGDAFMVSFQNVTSALLWCFQVQIQLLKENWPQELLESEDGREVVDEETGEILQRGLSVRMGIHWGWPVCEADPITRRMDYFGPMVNRASRISGAADGGQILASRDVVNELRAIMGTFEDDKNRGFMDEIVGGVGVDDHEDGMNGNVDEEEALRLLHPNVSRDVILLRRMGFAISDIGERRLKGLETPEFLNLVYPKSLTRRHLKALAVIENTHRISDAKAAEEGSSPSDQLTKAQQIQTPHQVFEPTIQLLNIDEIRALGFICLRLEAVAQGRIFKGIEEAIEGESSKPLLEHRNSAHNFTALSTSTATSRQMFMESYINRHPELSMYAIRDDATDDELHTVLKQLTGRIWIALSSLTLRNYLYKNGKDALGIDITTLVDMLG